MRFYNDLQTNMIISLIGMTGAGKTTVGQILARKLNYGFCDTDELISAAAKKSPAEIFAESGEEYFRNIESETLLSALMLDNTVLSCGGGIILREKNRELLRRISTVVWLTRPFEHIRGNAEILRRPPINNIPENYLKIFEARKSLYAQTCHFRIDSAGFTDAHEAAARIIADCGLTGLT